VERHALEKEAHKVGEVGSGTKEVGKRSKERRAGLLPSGGNYPLGKSRKGEEGDQPSKKTGSKDRKGRK